MLIVENVDRRQCRPWVECKQGRWWVEERVRGRERRRSTETEGGKTSHFACIKKEGGESVYGLLTVVDLFFYNAVNAHAKMRNAKPIITQGTFIPSVVRKSRYF